MSAPKMIVIGRNRRRVVVNLDGREFAGVARNAPGGVVVELGEEVRIGDWFGTAFKIEARPAADGSPGEFVALLVPPPRRGRRQYPAKMRPVGGGALRVWFGTDWKDPKAVELRPRSSAKGSSSPKPKATRSTKPRSSAKGSSSPKPKATRSTKPKARSSRKRFSYAEGVAAKKARGPKEPGANDLIPVPGYTRRRR